MLDTTETKVERLRSRQGVAALLGIGLSTLSKLEAKGDFPPRVQISERKFGWPDSAIRKFMDARST